MQVFTDPKPISESKTFINIKQRIYGLQDEAYFRE